MATEQREYQTQVYHVPSVTVQNEFQYPDSPVHVLASSASTPVSPAHSPPSPTYFSNSAPFQIASPVSSLYNVGDECIDNLKSATDVYRERGANMRALALLSLQVGGVAPNDKPKPATALTARKAAILRYEQQQKERIALKAKFKADKEAFGKREPVLVAPSRRRKLAETTRKVKRPSDEDEGMDTITDMKCQLDLDREEQAKNRAIRLLNGGLM